MTWRPTHNIIYEDTHQGSTEGIVYVTHSGGERVEFRPRLPALLEFTLKTAEDVFEREAALARRTHAAAHSAHAGDALLHEVRSSGSASNGS